MTARRPAGAPEPMFGRAGDSPPAGSRDADEARRKEQEGRSVAGSAQAPADEERKQVERDLEELLEETTRERDEYLDLAKRVQADFENYKRRVARDTEEAERRSKAKLAGELIPALDNLERALRAAGIDPASATEDEGDEGDGALARGVLLTYRELEGALNRAGVEAYDPVGERFDPNWHEALQTRAEDGTESGIVLEVVEKGYRLDGQVLRAARVIVSD
jgi:molecular chaperone GrpE